jgi:hypothetical protein
LKKAEGREDKVTDTFLILGESKGHERRASEWSEESFGEKGRESWRKKLGEREGREREQPERKSERGRK